MRSVPLILLLAVGTYSSTMCLAGGEDDASSRLKAIETDVAKAESAFRQLQAKEPGPSITPEGQRLYDIFRQKQADAEVTIVQIAKDDPRSDVGYVALEWFLMQPELYQDDPGVTALELMAIYHAADTRLGRVIAILSHYPPRLEQEPGYAPAVQLLRSVADKNPDRTTRGQAALGLAWLGKWKFDWAQAHNLPDQDKLESTAEAAYESLIRDYGDCRNLFEPDRSPRSDPQARGGIPQAKTLADQAHAELFELRRLRVGRVAPEITGEDLFGKRLKLSEYRGRVVLLVFWSSWCGPCMEKVPEEKKLVEHFRTRPFAIVGVNGDSDREVAKKTASSSAMTWRSFWNDGPDGPITREWNVRGWPTAYMIDAKGVIRQVDLHGAKLLDLLEQLVRESESSRGHDEQ